MNKYGEVILANNIDSEDTETHEIYATSNEGWQSIANKYIDVINNRDMSQRVYKITPKCMNDYIMNLRLK